MSAALVYNDVGRILQTNIREGSGSQAERGQRTILRGIARFEIHACTAFSYFLPCPLLLRCDHVWRILGVFITIRNENLHTIMIQVPMASFMNDKKRHLITESWNSVSTQELLTFKLPFQFHPLKSSFNTNKNKIKNSIFYVINIILGNSLSK
jgi:hypothetical protein